MSATATYRPLIRINLYHNYFLDDGATEFDDTAQLKSEQLLKYQLSEFASIVPSIETQRMITNQKMIFRQDSSGITLLTRARETAPNSGVFEPFIALNQNETLTFLLYMTDPLFENYSTVASVPSIPYLFTNKKPVTELGAFTYIDMETTTNSIDDFDMEPDTYEDFQSVLSYEENIGLFGIIHLEMAGDDTTGVDGNARNLIEPTGEMLSTHREFKIQIKNRSTIWNYRNAQDGSLVHSSDPTELPLVKNGIIGYSFDSEERPGAAPNRLIYEKDNNGNILKTFSEIYIN